MELQATSDCDNGSATQCKAAQCIRITPNNSWQRDALPVVVQGLPKQSLVERVQIF
ncbi:unnamed protein product, partial [Ceratitis capitata]